MNALSTIPAPAAVPFTRIIFGAWRVLHNGKNQPLNVATAANLAEVLDVALWSCKHKDVLYVLERDTLTKVGKLHLYQIKQGRPVWQRKADFAHPVQVRPLTASQVTSFEVDTFVPIEPWVWAPGCDVVGIDRSLVEG